MEMESTNNLGNTSPCICSFGVDCGASFSKLIYFQPKNALPLPSYVIQEILPKLRNLLPSPNLDLECRDGEATLTYIKIPSQKCLEFVEFVRESGIAKIWGIQSVPVTGGGAYKYSDHIQQTLNVGVQELNEFEMLNLGLNFVLNNNENEIFSVATNVTHFQNVEKIPVKLPDIYPCIMVNMGSGISILKINSPTSFERISGSHMGGGSFFSLCSYLTGMNCWDEIMEASKVGMSEHVDILVGDIYGYDDSKYAELGLKAQVIASSFGRLSHSEVQKDQYTKPDIVKSLLHMIANNISQIAYLNAKVKGVDNIFFTGGFVSENSYLWTRLSFAINFWSKGTKQALFVHHNTYLGAIGALLSQKKS